MLPLQTRAKITGIPRRSILKVLTLQEFINSRYEPCDCALWFDDSSALTTSRAMEDVEWGAIVAPAGLDIRVSGPTMQCIVSSPRDVGVIGTGDIIRLNERTNLVSVLVRRGSHNNSLFVTERCNSYCIMCSQPPVDKDDSSRINELFQVIQLVDKSEGTLGITGGEPTLLGSNLIRLLANLKAELPATSLHILTNGRRFAELGFTQEVGKVAHPSSVWAIPLYSDAPEIHDYVVQRSGAFSETLHGLMNLAGEAQSIELRVVLQQATVPRLRQLAHFIARNLSFVDHVAWMGLEPMGFARPNWQRLWIEPQDYVDALGDAIECLHNVRMATSIYNIPLCLLPAPMHEFAARSISDWKNSYMPECDGCALKERCAGFFSSATSKYVSQKIRPFAVHAGATNE